MIVLTVIFDNIISIMVSINKEDPSSMVQLHFRFNLGVLICVFKRV